MDITEVRVKILNQRDDKLQAYCSITINDEFVIRDIKIIKGSSGYFVAMPSRKIASGVMAPALASPRTPSVPKISLFPLNWSSPRIMSPKLLCPVQRLEHKGKQVFN